MPGRRLRQLALRTHWAEPVLPAGVIDQAEGRAAKLSRRELLGTLVGAGASSRRGMSRSGEEGDQEKRRRREAAELDREETLTK